MASATRILASATVGSLLVVCTSALAATEVRPAPAVPAAESVAPANAGRISGVVQDDQGKPISGVVVSALGTSTIVAVTGTDGRFEFSSLPPGPYLLRAHLVGYTTPRAQVVHVSANERSVSSIALRRVSSTLLTASLGQPTGDTAAAPPSTQDEPAPSHDANDDASEIGWRLRHARRGVLKDATIPTEWLMAQDDDSPFGGGRFTAADVLGRSIGAQARAASTFFSETPFSGQVNLLTSSSFNSPQQLFSNEAGARNTAFARLGAPVSDRADWTVTGAITQSDISSWSVAGAYITRPSVSSAHRYTLGMAYSTQRYDGGNLLTLRDVTEGSRNAGAVYGYDTFALSPNVALTYGVAYGRYDYLDTRGLFSPRLELDLVPAAGFRVKATATRTALAPGAEEFGPPNETGIWLPPQRTFSSIETGQPFRAEQTMRVAVAVERDLRGSTVGFRVFGEQARDQIATLFGTELPGEPAAQVGHYLVANAGTANATGYTASFRTAVAHRVRCGLEYSSVRAELLPAENLHYLLMVAPSAVRPNLEHIHDLSTTVEADVPETMTKVLVLYRLSDGFARLATGEENASLPRTDGRFDVQIRQSLPFMSFNGARWEMLLAVRNFFREDTAEQSVYDELLVLRPPKRVVGGVTLSF